jgi:beta-galactosidase
LSALETLLDLGERRSFESPELTSLNRLPPRATLVPFPSAELATTLSRDRSPWFALLDGEWDFRLLDSTYRFGYVLRIVDGQRG